MNQNAIEKHDEANAAAAALILRNRAAQPAGLLAWAELCQRTETAQDGQHSYPVPSRATAAAAQRQQPAKAATTARPMRQQQLPLRGVFDGTA